eukprot:g1413.t1
MPIRTLHDAQPDADNGPSPNSLYVGGASQQGAHADGGGGGGGASAAAAKVTITWFKDGFTVNDGPFRRVDDPENQAFLRAVSEGRVPRELIPGTGEGGQAGDVDVSMVDRRGEDYTPPPKPAYVAFGGGGVTLGGGGGGGAEAAVGAGVVSREHAAGSGHGLEPDSSLPTTTIQLRLACGRRVKAVLNPDVHTVGDVAALAARESHDSKSFSLLAGFPPRPLADHSQTLAAAGLKGAAITQKLSS